MLFQQYTLAIRPCLYRQDTSGDQGSTRANDILHQFPFSLPYTGYVNRPTGKAGPFDGGNFWTNAAEGAISAYALSYWSTKVYPARSSASPETDLLKTYGFTVRYIVFLQYRFKA